MWKRLMCFSHSVSPHRSPCRCSVNGETWNRKARLKKTESKGPSPNGKKGQENPKDDRTCLYLLSSCSLIVFLLLSSVLFLYPRLPLFPCLFSFYRVLFMLSGLVSWVPCACRMQPPCQLPRDFNFHGTQIIHTLSKHKAVQKTSKENVKDSSKSVCLTCLAC